MHTTHFYFVRSAPDYSQYLHVYSFIILETFLFCSNTKVGRKAQSARDFHLQEETGYCRKQEMQEIDSRQKKRLDGKKKTPRGKSDKKKSLTAIRKRLTAERKTLQ